jgi:hypothetical protein
MLVLNYPQRTVRFMKLRSTRHFLFERTAKLSDIDKNHNGIRELSSAVHDCYQCMRCCLPTEIVEIIQYPSRQVIQIP